MPTPCTADLFRGLARIGISTSAHCQAKFPSLLKIPIDDVAWLATNLEECPEPAVPHWRTVVEVSDADGKGGPDQLAAVNDAVPVADRLTRPSASRRGRFRR